MDKPVIVSAFHHPFKSEHATHIALAGQSIAEMIRASGNLDPLLLTTPGVRTFIDDRPVPRHEWETARPSAGQLVTIKVTPMGSGDGGKDVLRIVATIAVIAISIAAPYLAPTSWGLLAAGGGLSGYGVAASLAINIIGMLLINALIPPQMPKDEASAEGPDIYSVRGMRNTADPWGTCNKIYGRYKVYPKYAALPFTEMLGDDQYLRCLFDVGKAPLNIETSTEKIGETSLYNYLGIQIQHYNSNTQIDNPATFNGGAIYPLQVVEENLSAELEFNVQNLRTTSENIEEIQIELTFPQGLYTWSRSDGNRYAALTYCYIEYAPTGTSNWKTLGNEQIIKFPNNPGSSQTPTYDPFISDYFDVLSPFRVGSIIDGQTSGASATITWSNPNSCWLPNPNYDPNMPSYDYDDEGRPTANDNQAYTMQTFVTEVHVNITTAVRFLDSEPIIFHGRLYGRAFLGSVTSNYNSVTGIMGTKLSTYRYGVAMKVPKGQYDVRLTRLTPEQRPDIVDTMYWTALRGLRFTDDSGNPALPVLARDRQLIALRIKASGQLNGVIDQFNLIANAIIPVYSNGIWALSQTRNPTWAYVDVLRGDSCSNPVPDSRIDLTKMLAWAARNNTAGRTFDANIDFQKPRLEMLADIATTGRASFGMKDNKVSVVEDLSQNVPVAHIGPRNSWGYKGKKVFTDLPHAFRCRFVNAGKDFVADEIDVYDDGYAKVAGSGKLAATKFELLDYWGVTNSTNVAREARYMIAQARLRPETHEVTQDIENLVVTRGDLARFSHDVILVGLGNARINGVTFNAYSQVSEVSFDDVFAMETGKSYCCRFRLADGTSVYSGVTTVAGDNYNVTLTSPIPANNAPSTGDLVFFGEAGLETINCIITRVEAGNDLTAKITMVDDAPAVRSADQVLPEWESHITLPPVLNRTPPGVVIIATDYSAYDSNINDDGTYRAKLVVSFGLTAGFNQLTQAITGFQYEWRIDDGSWQTGILSVSARSFTLDVVNGYSYDVRIRSYSTPGLYSAWATANDINIVIDKIQPPDIKNLRVSGGLVPEGGSELGGEASLVQEFVGRDCEITWSPVYGGASAGSKVDGYKIEIRRTDESVLRTEFVTEIHYNYSFEKNRDDNASSAIRSFKFYVWAHNVWGEISEHAASIMVSNPEPDMSGITPAIVSRYNYIEVSWPLQGDLDMNFYELYYDDQASFSLNATTFALSKTHPTTRGEIHGLDYGVTYYVRVLPYDQFGVGIPTAEANGSSLLIPSINVQGELSGSIIMTDSNGNTAATLIKLYDGDNSTNGVTYPLQNQWEWIEYQYGLEDYFDRIALWSTCSSGSAKACYVAYSNDGGSNWNYLKAQADHQLNSDGELLVASSQSDATTNYWTLDDSFKWALFPNNITANVIRFYFYSNVAHDFYELVPSRILISELAAIGHLSAITSNIGTMLAGVLQSTNWDTTHGVMFDLDNRQLRFGGSSAPVIEMTESGVTIAAGLLKSSNWGTGAGVEFDLDNSQLRFGGSSAPVITMDEDGVTINAGTIQSSNWNGSSTGTQINLDSNTITVQGSSSLQILSGSIIVAPSGGYSTSDYVQLTTGSITFFNYLAGAHRPMAALKAVTSGTANNGDLVYIPGYWKTPPIVFTFPNFLQTYNATAGASQNQSLYLPVPILTQYSTNLYRFYAVAQLQYSGSTTNVTNNGAYYVTGAIYHTSYTSTEWGSGVNTDFPAGTRRVIVNTQCCFFYAFMVSSTPYVTGGAGYVGLQIKMAGAWYDVGTLQLGSSWNYDIYQYYWQFDSGTQGTDITRFRFKGISAGLGDQPRSWASSLNAGPWSGVYVEKIQLSGYTYIITPATVAANGSLNWIAIESGI